LIAANISVEILFSEVVSVPFASVLMIPVPLLLFSDPVSEWISFKYKEEVLLGYGILLEIVQFGL
jgi:hypothetical protein